MVKRFKGLVKIDTPASLGLKKILLLTNPLIPVYWKPVVLLLLLTPFLTELLTNNIPASHFFKPGLFFTLVILVYGPILLIREVAIRWNYKLAGYVLFGLVYGMYNEGLLGKTIFQQQIANTAFDNYGFVGGINLPWTAVIVVFHAFFAFLFPVIIVYNIYPKAAFKPWMKINWLIFFSVVFFLYISYAFLKNTFPAKPVHYVSLILVMTLLIFLSGFFKGGLTLNDKKGHAWIICCYGIVFVASTFTLAYIIASSGIHFLYFIGYAIINLLIAILLLNGKYGIITLLDFVLAAQMGFAVSTILVAVSTKSKTGIISGSIFALVFASILLMMILKRKKRLNFQQPDPLKS